MAAIFADDTFKCIFLNENWLISIKISLKFILNGPIGNISALVQIMAWRRPGDKPLSEPMLPRFTDAYICSTRGRPVNIWTYMVIIVPADVQAPKGADHKSRHTFIQYLMAIKISNYFFMSWWRHSKCSIRSRQISKYFDDNWYIIYIYIWDSTVVWDSSFKSWRHNNGICGQFWFSHEKQYTFK